MIYKRLLNIVIIGLLASLTITLQSCKTKPKESGFNPHVVGFTSGNISIKSHIKVRLSENIPDAALNVALEKKPFKFSPNIKGEAYLVDEQTVEFRPTEMLTPGTEYAVTFNLVDVLPKVESEFKVFDFSFSTIQSAFYYSIGGLGMYSQEQSDLYYLSGMINTSDFVANEKVEKILTADPAKFKVSWTHNNNQHKFVMDSIKSSEKAFDIKLKFNGKAINYDFTRDETVKVPSIYEFSLLNVTVNNGEQQSIVCHFSSPIDNSQNLRGLITLESASLRFKVDLNEITIYLSSKLIGSRTLTIHQGLKNAAGGKFAETYSEEVVFENYKPEVKYIGKGTILPNSEGLILPFHAVSLKAVVVKIIRVYESNVIQFLQVNQFDGKREMKRAGRLAALKTIKLGDENDAGLRRWGTYAIDLSKIIDPEPGAIYRVELSFQKRHAIYPCDNTSEPDDSNNEEDYWGYGGPNRQKEDELLSDEDMFIQQESKYDDPARSSQYYIYYYDDDDEDYYDYSYRYEDRDNPCKDAYYGNRRNVARNVIASNLGIIAKEGENNTLYATISNLVTLAPMSGVEVELYNFQQQLIAEGTTNAEGMAEIPYKGKPFVLIAKSGKQRGYLRLDDGTSLSLSSFEVSGNKIERGLKGYIYGERGVWRPGDTLFLSFILQDRDKVLPANHPVNLDIVNPRGQVVSKQTKVSDVNGFYTFIYKTDDEAPTGNWTANVRVGGTTFSKTLKIETIKPNRLKINLTLDDDPIVLDKKLSGKLESKWLHGAPAKNLEADISLTLNSIATKFKGYDSYIFDSPVRKFDAEEKSVYNGKLNENGELTFSANVSANQQAPGMLRATFTTRVFEESGEFSIDNMTATVMPYKSFVGLLEPKGTGYRNMLETDKDQMYNIATVDAKGNPVDRKGVTVKIYKLGWSWWWNSSNEQLANYAQGSYSTPVFDTKVNTVGGKGSFTYKAKHEAWGFYLILLTDPESKHSAGIVSYIDWPNWGGRPRQQGGEGVTQLMFSADKPKYNVGEKAKIIFPSSEGSKAFISIESGTKVLRTTSVSAKKDETEFTLDITADMVPNVYVYITLVQPHAQTQNDAPIRLYGVIPIMAEDPQTKLAPVIDMPETLRPEEKFTIKISEQNKQEMTYTLAIVDEGLLDLTRFKTPNAWNDFFAKEALGVRTWDMYDAVVGAYGGKIEQLFAIGGDGDAGDNARSKVSRFKPVVTFIGPFTLGKGSSNKHDIILPNYIGSVRVMVVAGNKKAYGSAEKAIPVRKPLMAMATLPRVLGPGEEVDLPATIFAMEPNIKRVSVELKANDMFTILDGDKKTLNFSSPGDDITTFKLKVKERVGKGVVKVIASSGGEKSEYDIEIEVRNANPVMHKVTEAVVEGGKIWDGTYVLPGMEGTNKASLEVSYMPPLNLGERLGYLLHYPHGCLEQTTSGAFPQLYLSGIMDLSKEQIVTAERNVKAGLDRIKLFVTLDGGFSYWPGERFPNLWATSYVGHFMLEAEAKGFTVSQSIKSNWIKFQKREASNWTRNSKKYYDYYSYDQSDFDQAYRLYTLALAKDPDMGAMNRLKERSDLSLQARWALASAYALAGQTKTAKDLINNATMDVNSYSGFSQSFGSRERDWAIILDALIIMKEKAKGFEMVQRISKALNSNMWMSTQTSAYCLMALSKFAETEKGSQEINMEYSHNGGNAQKVSSSKPIWQDQLTMLKENGTMKINNKGKNTLFIRIFTEGIPIAGQETAAESNMKLSVQFTDAAGHSIDVSKLQQGADFIANVTISNPGLMGNYTNIALSQIFPSGWEITNDRLADLNNNSAGYDYQDIRDDRVYTYFGLAAGKSRTISVKLNAAYIGKFYLPATSCEAMYDRGISANNTGHWVEVVK
ncbi:MAG: hypothetical protein LBL90_07655 [Prevotellaceae bacterium]|jgi:uncharacterized protein YfaS (alpha-2-macroglobulin family)|nr:hypothetical protein [Prevotellaceae bacterium]